MRLQQGHEPKLRLALGAVAAAVLVAAVPAHGADVAFELPIIPLESPEPGPRTYDVGVSFGSGIARSLPADRQGAGDFGGTSVTQLRADLVASDRFSLGLVLQPLKDSQGTETGAHLAGRARFLLRSAGGSPGSWNTALVLSAGGGSLSDKSGAPDDDVPQMYSVRTSSGAAMLVFGRHIGERGLFFGGPSYTSIRYTAGIERWVTVSGDWVEGGCGWFGCWGGYYDWSYEKQTRQLSGSAQAIGLSIGYAYRWPRNRFTAQLALTRVEDGAVADTRAQFMVGLDLFLGRRRTGADT